METPSRKELQQIVAGLRKSALFAGLPDRRLKDLARIALVRKIKPDAVVVSQGEKGIGFYVIFEGRVRVRKGSKTVAQLGPGDFFGELALFDDRPRSADVVATEPTTVAVLSRWEFWGFAANHPDLLRLILQEMSRRLQETAKVSPV
jgi:CRP/FNR family transcriptional regulator, cyclic AMP receptor protein